MIARTAPAWRQLLPMAALSAGLAYFVLLGGTALGETGGTIRMANAVVGAILIASFIWQLPASVDRFDATAVGALVLFVLAGMLSAFPRQSLDAVVAALAYAAAFYVARRVMQSETARRLFLWTLMALSVAMTLVAAARWLIPIAEWWAAVGWRVVPRLGIELAAYPWGHRHDLAVLVALLYPAWWAGHPSPMRRMAGVVFGALGLCIIVVDGSRALWLAIALASAIVFGPRLTSGLRSRSGSMRWILVAGVAGASILAVTGIGVSLLQRAASSATLDWRAALWNSLLDSWVQHPLAGTGPGAFAWILQSTAYFDTRSWAPRHPDNAFIHALAETGLLGMAAITALAVILVPAILRADSRAARWALSVFGIALFGANPSDFAFILVVVIGWVAFALPVPPIARAPRRRRRWSTFPSLGIAGVIGVAIASTAIATMTYEAAARAVGSGDLVRAEELLGAAIALDPGLALYSRQRGTARLVRGEVSGAIADLERAALLNPADDLTMRTLSLAQGAAGDAKARDATLQRAVALQRSDPTNLLLSAAIAERSGHGDVAGEMLAEVVQAWPAVIFSDGWRDILPTGFTSQDVVDAAYTRWEAREPMPELEGDQGVWLAALAGRPDPTVAVPQDVSDVLYRAVACKPEVTVQLAGLDPRTWTDPWFWLLSYRASVVDGQPDSASARMAQLMGSTIEARDPGDTSMNPLDENDRLSVDRFGYRRRPITWPSATMRLPSPDGGLAVWLTDPTRAAENSGLGVCR
ncbi:MAG: O-antigen ligase family protein [Candidatus Limnocylindria bacterium]